MSEQLYQIFTLQPYARTTIKLTLITPDPISHIIVKAAWSYAVRYTAKGLDLPDYDEAIKLLLKRHPSWKVYQTIPVSIPIDLNVADDDQPDVPQK